MGDTLVNSNLPKAIVIAPIFGSHENYKYFSDIVIALKSMRFNVTCLSMEVDEADDFQKTHSEVYPITTVGQWIPKTFFGYFHSFFYVLKMIWVALYATFFVIPIHKTSLIFCETDFIIPILKLKPKVKLVYYYKHDRRNLLDEYEGSLTDYFYAQIEFFQATVMNMADKIIVTSEYMKEIYKDLHIDRATDPSVLFPIINKKYYDQHLVLDAHYTIHCISSNKFMFVSINPIEEESDHRLAIHSFATLRVLIDEYIWDKCLLVICGRYDSSKPENVRCFQRIVQYATNMDISKQIFILTQCTYSIREALLKNCFAVINTPADDLGTGIIAFEAAYFSKPLITTLEGGLNETVLDHVTGHTLTPTPYQFACGMSYILEHFTETKNMTANAKYRYLSQFGFEQFVMRLSFIVQDVLQITLDDL